MSQVVNRSASGHLKLAALAVAGFAVACQPTAPAPPPVSTAPAFAAFVDGFLDQFAAHHPSIAGGNGLHQADDRLEDFSAAAIAAEIAMWRDMKARLAAIPTEASAPRGWQSPP